MQLSDCKYMQLFDCAKKNCVNGVFAAHAPVQDQFCELAEGNFDAGKMESCKRGVAGRCALNPCDIRYYQVTQYPCYEDTLCPPWNNGRMLFLQLY